MAHFKYKIRSLWLSITGSLITGLLTANSAFAQDDELYMEESTGMTIIDYVLIVILLAAGLFLVYWVFSIMRGLTLRRRQNYSMHDAQPSVDERLMSELAPMQVALLRGNVQGFYEKSRSVSLQIITSRGLIEPGSGRKHSEEIVKHLKTIGVDPVFLDCFEAIMRRCNEVLEDGERPDDTENRKMIEDMRTLIRMRPKASRKQAETVDSEEETD